MSNVLTETENAILVYKIANPGATGRQIAADLGLTPQYVSTLCNQSPLKEAIEDHLADIVDAAKSHLIGVVNEAVGTLVTLMRGAKSENVKRQAARDLIFILAKRGDEDDLGDIEYESVITRTGQVELRKVDQRKKRLEEGGGNDGGEEQTTH